MLIGSGDTGGRIRVARRAAGRDDVQEVTLAGELWYPSDSKGGIEYQVLLVAGLLTILLIGSGRLALDYGRGWATRPKWGSLALAVLGIAVAVTIWVVFNGTNPLDSPGNPV